MESVDFNNMRRAMVDSQLRTSGVAAPWVIAAMGNVARENFAPAVLRQMAYMDRSLPLGGGRFLNPPVTAGMMLAAADVSADDSVLVIGAATGYVAALVAQQAGTVMALEEDAGLFAEAAKQLAKLKNVNLVDGPLNAGVVANAPYSLIIIDGAVEEIPDAVLAQAAEDGRIVTGLSERGVTRLAFGYVRGGKVALRPLADTEIATLPGFARAKEFVF